MEHVFVLTVYVVSANANSHNSRMIILNNYYLIIKENICGNIPLLLSP